MQKACSWDDVSQAEAYAHTLAAFFGAFPEYAGNDLYLTGESYAGQYVPNIASWIVAHEGALPAPLHRVQEASEIFTSPIDEALAQQLLLLLELRTGQFI